MEKLVLLDERLLATSVVRLLGLELHVGVCDLGNFRNQEQRGEKDHKDGNREVDPLHIIDGGLVVEGE